MPQNVTPAPSKGKLFCFYRDRLLELIVSIITNTAMSSLKSMTAYARHAQTLGAQQLVWELRSVNHRYLDAHFRLPEQVNDLEPLIRKQLAARLARGRVDINLNIKADDEQSNGLSINPRQLARWLDWQQQVLNHAPGARPLSVMEILSDKSIFEKDELPDHIAPGKLLASFEPALQALLKQREAEGARLQRILEEKLDAIARITTQLNSNMSTYEQAHQARWQARVEKLSNETVDPLRLNQELALLISKVDVREELDRLASHVTEFRDAINSDNAVGRRLDFLLQEFNREANTLGSKSIHQDITNASVELKVLIDQLREQVQNIE